MRHGYHYGPCRSSAVPLLLIVAGITAVVFWPTVVAVGAAVALIIKLTLIALATVAVLGTVAAITVAVRRARQPEPSRASVVAVQSTRHSTGGELAVAEQLAALTAAVNRLERDRQPALPAPSQAVVIDQQALAALLAGLSRMAANEAQPRELAERGGAR